MMSPYADQDLSNRHFVTVPGVLAFFYYPSSYGFLLVAMLAIGILGAVIEAATFKWGGGNMLLCSLVGLVVAYRYVHFGYAPGHSYLLLSALIYLFGRLLARRGRTGEQTSRIA